MFDNLPIISLLLFCLPVGAGLIWLLPGKTGEQFARVIALLIGIMAFLLSAYLVILFDPAKTSFQFVEKLNWISTLNIHYHVGVDGISVLFPMFASLLFILVILSSWNQIRSMTRLYYSLLLILEASIIGIFVSLDTILFFLFWEMTLIPLFFLLSLWGIGPHRRYAAVKYTMLMLAGGVPLLFGFIMLAFNHAEVNQLATPAGLSFNYVELLHTHVKPELQVLILLFFVIGFGIKTPLFPFHTWMPTIANEGPPTIAALITGLKIGAFGFIRFVVPLTPAAIHEYHGWLIAFGMIGLIYGAVIAIGQSNIRRMLAYSSISHVGLVIIGITVLNTQGINGAIFQLLNFTIIAGGLLLLTSFLHQRIGTTNLKSLGGLAGPMPVFASFFMLLSMASIGLPGTSGFIAEFFLIYGAFKANLAAGILGLLVVILSAAYIATHYRKTFFGPVTSEDLRYISDLTRREKLISLILIIMVLMLGLYPNFILNITQASSDAWIAHTLKAN